MTRSLRQPMVIAEITAGILLGPSLLGWLAPDFSAALFPKESMGLLGMMSQVGLIFFMFLIGLELDPKLLRGRAHTSVAISHSSIVLPFLLGGILALYLYPRLAPANVPFSSFLLFMGVAMSITAFPVLARILVERRLLRSKLGAITIACAAVDDVTAWCILAFVVSIVRASGVAGAIRTSAFAFVYIGFMVWVIRPFFGRFADRTRLGLSQNIVAVVMVLLLVSSWLTELIGIHALFGAFLFGAVLPKNGGLAAALAEKIEDLVVVVLLPLFFAYSGLRTQIGLLDTPGSWVICAAITVVACLGKFGGSAVAARLTGLGWRESSAIGILMNTRGLMELIVLNMGLDLGVISPTLFTMLVLMALITTFMTTPLLQLTYPIERFAQELTDPQEEDEAKPGEPAGAPAADGVAAAAGAPDEQAPYTALVCVAYERSGPGLITLGSAIAGAPDVDAKLYALRLRRATDRGSFFLDKDAAGPGGDPSGEEAALVPLLDTARKLGVNVRPLSFLSDLPGRDICDVSKVKHANLVLLGWHKPILTASMLGGTVHEVMLGTPSDVGVFVDRGLERIGRLLVPYLGSEHDRAALYLARRIAESTGANVVVLHIVKPDGAGERLGAEQRVREEFQERGRNRPYDVSFEVVQHESPEEAVIVESRAGYDLVLVGVGESWGLAHRTFGLQSEAILKQSPASVLVVRKGSGVTEPARSERAAEPGHAPRLAEASFSGVAGVAPRPES
ncbi:cation:proton antiporter [Pendulispora albinea]|uniref:Cation:proton antiporter n=1 Tax=Pendulispora albinea TaxID=2741071 RepID=A0ABZ2MC61_9BACT